MLGTRQTNCDPARWSGGILRDVLSAAGDGYRRRRRDLGAGGRGDRAAAAFGDWTGDRPARADLPPLPGLDGVRERHVSMPEKSQSDIIMGWHAMPRLDPDFDQARLAEHRARRLRHDGAAGDERARAPGHGVSRVQPARGRPENGMWLAVAGVNPANVDPRDQRDARRGAAAGGRARARRRAGRLQALSDRLAALQLETNDGVASILVDIEWQGLGLDYVERYTGIINNLTADEVQQAAQKYLATSKYVLAVARDDRGSSIADLPPKRSEVGADWNERGQPTYEGDAISAIRHPPSAISPSASISSKCAASPRSPNDTASGSAGACAPTALADCGMRAESLAARWAAKEAVAKALGTGFGPVGYLEGIEVVQDESGCPHVHLHGRAAWLAEAPRPTRSGAQYLARRRNGDCVRGVPGRVSTMDADAGAQSQNFGNTTRNETELSKLD